MDTQSAVTNSTAKQGWCVLLIVAIATLTGCAWIEGLGRALNIAVNVAQAPAQINRLELDPEQVLVLAQYDPYCQVFYLPGDTTVRWEAIGKRIELYVEGQRVHRQDTTEVRDVIAGEKRVYLQFYSTGIVTLRVYNAVDSFVEQTVTATVIVFGSPSTPCTSCIPPECPN